MEDKIEFTMFTVSFLLVLSVILAIGDYGALMSIIESRPTSFWFWFGLAFWHICWIYVFYYLTISLLERKGVVIPWYYRGKKKIIFVLRHIISWVAIIFIVASVGAYVFIGTNFPVEVLIFICYGGAALCMQLGKKLK